MSLWYCATCELLVKSSVNHPYCHMCRKRILAKDTHLIIPRAELEELVAALRLAGCRIQRINGTCAESMEADGTAAKFKAKYLL